MIRRRRIGTGAPGDLRLRRIMTAIAVCAFALVGCASLPLVPPTPTDAPKLRIASAPTSYSTPTIVASRVARLPIRSGSSPVVVAIPTAVGQAPLPTIPVLVAATAVTRVQTLPSRSDSIPPTVVLVPPSPAVVRVEPSATEVPPPVAQQGNSAAGTAANPIPTSVPVVPVAPVATLAATATPGASPIPTRLPTSTATPVPRPTLVAKPPTPAPAGGYPTSVPAPVLPIPPTPVGGYGPPSR